nr:hypothetical protein [Bradyrhizobium shewense]
MAISVAVPIGETTAQRLIKKTVPKVRALCGASMDAPVFVSITRDEVADGHSRGLIEQRKHRLEYLAPHIFEIDVNAGLANGGEISR